jgi:hypothetical protein
MTLSSRAPIDGGATASDPGCGARSRAPRRRLLRAATACCRVNCLGRTWMREPLSSRAAARDLGCLVRSVDLGLARYAGRVVRESLRPPSTQYSASRPRGLPIISNHRRTAAHSPRRSQSGRSRVFSVIPQCQPILVRTQISPRESARISTSFDSQLYRSPWNTNPRLSSFPNISGSRHRANLRDHRHCLTRKRFSDERDGHASRGSLYLCPRRSALRGL